MGSRAGKWRGCGHENSPCGTIARDLGLGAGDPDAAVRMFASLSRVSRLSSLGTGREEAALVGQHLLTATFAASGDPQATPTTRSAGSPVRARTNVGARFGARELWALRVSDHEIEQ